ncbi:5-oxoprolinase subunit PxpB [Pseudomonas fragi]|jgi:5-oxoprolinase (ATP-hydrolysing) subunit B|uniref:5-oxoprolinase subunit PxpB n=1 Tax=Pseudomonas fragi TaxID=296 RepID=A0A9Q5AZC1_PSEFR|nr:5-oxoprolinase subunit PxpB [Pseudomonas fragi]MBM1201385.1 5-oxoprolinase subunit PxpB [Pseudomonas fragi]NNB25417.1 5-oxoprolinase subunit PxpB [Pseudomonas fragi]NNB34249.1 5-oxoprolinase subunit PxpB [Pseudomonas fragi]NNB49405.1 5-oxoprolinase subunit PxpB [Pseudomonas fragi]NNB55963.1 5-oxoprolinase subunit PxpB [Pseudomonas fragi]
MSEQPVISLLGSTALLFEAPGALALVPQQHLWNLALQAAQWPEIDEAVPGMNNLMLTFRTPPRDLAGLRERLLQAWEQSTPLALEGRIIELPVVYGGEHGPHMQDVVEHTGLDIDTIAHLHSEPLYPVYALGSHPGYCYLGGMDGRLATPRRQVPVLNIGAGAVSIGGVQTGVSASAGPSGWNTIGRTEMAFFDPTQNPPAILRPGDQLRFRIERIIR